MNNLLLSDPGPIREANKNMKATSFKAILKIPDGYRSRKSKKNRQNKDQNKFGQKDQPNYFTESHHKQWVNSCSGRVIISCSTSGTFRVTDK